MHRFWEMIEPILGALRPQTIVEIGSDTGLNTKNLIAFCQKKNAKLHVVDPLPKYDVSEWQERYAEHAVFHQALSLNAIPLIGRFEAILIDGDHNWYTVFHELRLIEKRSTELSQPFPLVMLHDVDWPYGRRDLYYDPGTIPDTYRKPYERKGMLPDSPELLEEGGFNCHLHNAIYENSLQNGVLTALEDFMTVTDQRLDLAKVPGLHGLGILVPSHLREQNKELAAFLKTLDFPPAAARHVEHIERVRLETETQRQEIQARLDELGAESDELRAKLEKLGAKRRAELEKLAELKELETGWREERAELQAIVEALETKRRVDLDELEAKRQAERAELQAKLDDFEAQRRIEVGKLTADRKEQSASLMNELKEQAGILRAKNRKAEELAEDVRHKSREAEKLTRWIEELDLGISALLNSRRWKTGQALGELYRQLLLRPRVPMTPEYIDGIIGQFYAWRNGSAKSPVPLPSAPKTSVTPAEPENEVPDPGSRSVDVVVCVHNALDDVKECLTSVIENTHRVFTLYIVNDGSDAVTSAYLREFSSGHESCMLLENPVAEGYTRAANKGLRASTADYVILLNSDTIVSPGWVEKLLECGESDPHIGIVGPLSNAASWQSVPEIKDNGDWAVNSLPDGYDVGDMAKLVDAVSEKRFPRAPFINGFCLAIKRSLIDSIGYFDEDNFPYGYGEENDYCLRARDAGFELAVADHTYIFHAKSKSYSHERRQILRKPASEALKRKHDHKRISQGVDLMLKEPALEEIRQRLRTKLKAPPKTSPERSPFRVLFLLPCGGGGGGVHSVVQEVQGMRNLGVYVQVAVPTRYRKQYVNDYPGMDHDLFYFFDSKVNLVEHAKGFDVVVATIFTSVKLLKLIHESSPEILPAYYIQDYEPWICEGDPDLAEEARASYTAIPDMLCFAKTDWLRTTVEELHGIEVRKVFPSLDHSVYYPRFRPSGGTPVEVTAMIRPSSPRRSPLETMQVLKHIKVKYQSGVKITVFGCKPDDPRFLALPRNFDFENRGVLVREEVSETLRDADVFLDLSAYQAFGRTGLEAMACGCATVLPKNGGTSEYARHRQNTLLVDTRDFGDMVNAASELVEDESLRLKISSQGILTAADYSIQRAAISELSLFQEELQERSSNDARPRFGAGVTVTDL